MNLQPITPSRHERNFSHLFGQNGDSVGRCVAVQPAGGECGNFVYSRTGFADLDGAPFKAYYCHHCAQKMAALSNTN